MSYRKKHIPVIMAGEAYDRVADQYDHDLLDYDNIDRRLFTLALPKDLQGLQIADIGGGSGRWADRLVQRGAQVTVIDPARNMMSQARKKNKFIKTIEGVVEHIPLDDRFSDITICAFVLGYVADLKFALTELIRITKPGGKIMISNSSERKSPIHRAANRDPFLIDVTFHRPELFTEYLEEMHCHIEVFELIRTLKGVHAGTVIVASTS